MTVKQTTRSYTNRGSDKLKSMSAAERGDLAIQLRAQGWTWVRISAALGYSHHSNARTAALRRAIALQDDAYARAKALLAGPRQGASHAANV